MSRSRTNAVERPAPERRSLEPYLNRAGDMLEPPTPTHASYDERGGAARRRRRLVATAKSATVVAQLPLSRARLRNAALAAPVAMPADQQHMPPSRTAKSNADS
jgi:hypothetical protein